MSVITHAFDTAVIERSSLRNHSFALEVGRYAAAIVGGMVLAAMLVLPVSLLPGSHGNVYSGLSFLVGLGWFVALNYVRKPLLAALFVGLGVFGLVGAILSLSSPGWLWAVWGVNASVGVVRLAFSRRLVFSHRIVHVPADRVLAWTVFHLCIMMLVGGLG